MILARPVLIVLDNSPGSDDLTPWLPPTGHVKEVTATIQLSWDLASEQAKFVLRAMTCLAPRPVPRRLLREILNLPSENRIEDPLGEAISELAIKLSLAELEYENEPSLHRFIFDHLLLISGGVLKVSR